MKFAKSLIDYPDLEGDEARRAIWLHDVPLAATHHLRQALNNSAGDPRPILEKYEIPIVASVLKLYLLELPGTFIILFGTLIRALMDSGRFSCFIASLRNHQNHLLDHRQRNVRRRQNQSVAKHTWPAPTQQHSHT